MEFLKPSNVGSFPPGLTCAAAWTDCNDDGQIRGMTFGGKYTNFGGEAGISTDEVVVYDIVKVSVY